MEYTYKEPMGLATRILHEKKENGILTAIVCGRFGVGKSCYCIKAGHQVFREQGFTHDESWMQALDAIVFEPSEFGRKLKNQKKKQDLIILDDSSVHIGNDLFHANLKKYGAYKQVLTTIRTKTYALLYNCPNPEELSKFVRNSDAYQIYITKTGEHYKRRGTSYGYRRINTRAGLRRIQVQKWSDNFSCWIPNEYYKIYLKKRRGYIKKPIDELIKSDEK